MTFEEQVLAFARTEQWILDEFRRQCNRRPSVSRNRALAELSRRADHLRKEYCAWHERVVGDS